MCHLRSKAAFEKAKSSLSKSKKAPVLAGAMRKSNKPEQNHSRSNFQEQQVQRKLESAGMGERGSALTRQLEQEKKTNLFCFGFLFWFCLFGVFFLVAGRGLSQMQETQNIHLQLSQGLSSRQQQPQLRQCPAADSPAEALKPWLKLALMLKPRRCQLRRAWETEKTLPKHTAGRADTKHH